MDQKSVEEFTVKESKLNIPEGENGWKEDGGGLDEIESLSIIEDI